MSKSLAYQLAESEITIMRLEDELAAARAEVDRLRAMIPSPVMLQKIARVAQESSRSESIDVFVWASVLHGDAQRLRAEGAK